MDNPFIMGMFLCLRSPSKWVCFFNPQHTHLGKLGMKSPPRHTFYALSNVMLDMAFLVSRTWLINKLVCARYVYKLTTCADQQTQCSIVNKENY